MGRSPRRWIPPSSLASRRGRIVNALFEGLATLTLTANPVQERLSRGHFRGRKGLQLIPAGREMERWSAGDSERLRGILEAHPVAGNRGRLPLLGSYLKNAQPFAEGKVTDFSEVGVKALDDQTLEVTIENPTPFFLDLCATPPLQPVPVERIRESGDDWVKPGRIVGDGDYVLEEWRIERQDPPAQEHQLLERHQGRYGKRRSPPHQCRYGSRSISMPAASPT